MLLLPLWDLISFHVRETKSSAVRSLSMTVSDNVGICIDEEDVITQGDPSYPVFRAEQCL